MKTFLKNCNLVDLNKGTCEKLSILIEDERIKKIDNSTKLNFDELLTIDLSGKYVHPGLWDVHTHIGDLL